MVIKHLVISGGGPIGFRYLGILKQLNIMNYWKRENITSIYATSIGTFIGTLICLNFEWDVIMKYVIDRPWQDVFKLSGKQIFDMYNAKGLYDKRITSKFFKSLLESKNLNININLKEFFEYSKIDFHFYTFELNDFEIVDISYKTHPDLALLDVITMSCALPGLVVPTCINNKCYIDGGIMVNYPINYCIKNNNKLDEILGLNYINDEHKLNSYATIINNDSSILDFFIGFSINTINYISKHSSHIVIPNEIICNINEPLFGLELMEQLVNNKDMRKTWIDNGIQDAKNYFKKN